MRRFPILLASVAVMLLSLLIVTATPTRAITGNYVKDVEHPFVGLAVFYDENGEFLWRCSGSLLTPIVFLTAGHCTAPDGADVPTSARVYLQQDAGANYDPVTEVDPITGYPETCADTTLGKVCATSDELHNYGFNDFEGFPDNKDLGLVILDQPITVSEYGALAGVGTLDPLATRRGQQNLTFTVSGYGVTDAREHPASRALSFRERLMAQVKLVNLRSAQTKGFNLQTSANAGGGRGGACYGDSGGPVFLGGTSSNLIVSVTSFGNSPWCTGVDFSYRVDTAEALAWIQATVPAGEVNQIQIVAPHGKAKSEQHNGGKGKGHHRR
jgi:hypothetical protein